MFTGDRSGDWLFRALHQAGFANQPESAAVDDGLALSGAAITAVCHCAPPGNKPTADEMSACSAWLLTTVEILPPTVLVALGQIAWQAVHKLARELGWCTGPRPAFAHGAVIGLSGDRWLIGSYHPSQQNTFTGRLTVKMLDDIFTSARELLSPELP